MSNYNETTIPRAMGHKPNPAHSKAYQIAEAMYPAHPPEKKDVTCFHKAALLKSLGFPGFEKIDTSVTLSQAQEQKLIDAGKGPNPTDRVRDMKNRMLLEMAFGKEDQHTHQMPTGKFSDKTGMQEFEEMKNGEMGSHTATPYHRSMDF